MIRPHVSNNVSNQGVKLSFEELVFDGICYVEYKFMYNMPVCS